MAQPGTRVYLVDDDAGVRRALTRVLRHAGHQTTAFGTAEDFLIGVELDDLPACLVVDLKMPGLSGLDLQDLLLERGIELSLVFISGRADMQSGVQAMKSGAVDFLEKPVSDETLLAAVARGLEQDGERRIQRAERAQLQERLGTTEKTVKVHRSRVMQKMGAHSLAELVRMADKIAHRL